MSQSRLASFIEAKVNLVLGFAISMVVWQFFGPVMGYEVNLHDNFIITAVFTVVSLARSYTLRRLFNWWHHHRPAATITASPDTLYINAGGVAYTSLEQQHQGRTE